MFGRPGLPAFEYVRPENRDSVVQLLEGHGESARLMMGGTDLFPGLRDGRYRPATVIDVKRVPGMQDMEPGDGGRLLIGAGVTMNQLASHAWVRKVVPMLAQAAGSVASVQIRNRATVGGNLCNASPCADMAPSLLVLEATVSLYSSTGLRSMLLTEFLVGPGQTALGATEFMVRIELPGIAPGSMGCYHKLGRVRAGDLALVGVAVLAEPDPSLASGYRFKIGLGSVSPVPMRAQQAEEILASGDLSDRSLHAASKAAMDAARPISDVRGSAEYQKAMVRAVALRALREVRDQLDAR